MMNQLDEDAQVFLELAVADAFGQYKQTDPDYAALCQRENVLYCTLERIFKDEGWDDGSALYGMMREYFFIMSKKWPMDVEFAYLQGARNAGLVAKHVDRDRSRE